MDNSSGVCGVEPLRNLRAPVQQRVYIQRTSADLVLQSLPIQKFHGDEPPPLEFIYFVNRANVGMVQRRGGLCFTLESLERQLVLSQIFRKKLQRDKTPQLDVLSL